MQHVSENAVVFVPKDLPQPNDCNVGRNGNGRNGVQDC